MRLKLWFKIDASLQCVTVSTECLTEISTVVASSRTQPVVCRQTMNASILPMGAHGADIQYPVHSTGLRSGMKLPRGAQSVFFLMDRQSRLVIKLYDWSNCLWIPCIPLGCAQRPYKEKNAHIRQGMTQGFCYKNWHSVYIPVLSTCLGNTLNGCGLSGFFLCLECA